ncbi:hypothetical protein Tco_0875248 [Tanacetum coccineum]|uniref:Uncharacterized protein n=1 Tax=Tanacetum coccineum TaxID=301880 RepID=A0ABQ5BRX0_9ASTR
MKILTPSLYDGDAVSTRCRHLTYLEFLSKFLWYGDRKSWSPRQNSKSSIGRLAYVHLTSGELFFLRMLRCHQKGFRDFLEEACASATPAELGSVFAHILLHCDVTDPYKLWRKYWKEMSHDMPEKVSQTVKIPDYHLNDDGLQGNTLYEIEVILNNCGKSLQNFCLPPPPEGLLAQLANRLLMEDRNYNQNALMQEKNDSVPKRNAQQKIIYDLIINANAGNH